MNKITVKNIDINVTEIHDDDYFNLIEFDQIKNKRNTNSSWGNIENK